MESRLDDARYYHTLDDPGGRIFYLVDPFIDISSLCQCQQTLDIAPFDSTV
jgi:hypothetical protein